MPQLTGEVPGLEAGEDDRWLRDPKKRDDAAVEVRLLARSAVGRLTDSGTEDLVGDDVASDVVIKFMEHVEAGKPEITSVSGWTWTVTKRELAKHIRNENVLSAREVRHGRRDVAAETEPVQMALEVQDAHQLLQSVLRKLTNKREQRVLALELDEKLSRAEIAREMGISMTYVSTLRNRALDKIGKKWEASGMKDAPLEAEVGLAATMVLLEREHRLDWVTGAPGHVAEACRGGYEWCKEMLFRILPGSGGHGTEAAATGAAGSGALMGGKAVVGCAAVCLSLGTGAVVVVKQERGDVDKSAAATRTVEPTKAKTSPAPIAPQPAASNNTVETGANARAGDNGDAPRPQAATPEPEVRTEGPAVKSTPQQADAQFNGHFGDSPPVTTPAPAPAPAPSSGGSSSSSGGGGNATAQQSLDQFSGGGL